LYDGYSTISLGYAGLYECVMYMTGHSHTGEGKEFAKKVMQFMNDKCSEWKNAENIGYSVYGTPLESTTYKFAKKLQKRFGCIKDVTDHIYITNSYHVNVREKIDAFTKLKFEAEFQELSPGGAISYVELSTLTKNPEAALSIVQYIYENIMYAEINTKLDICYKCNYEGEVSLNDMGNGRFEWKCPCCGNTDKKFLSVTRRTCGYLGQNWWNAGRTSEIHDRVLHL
jgi:ribonucleoside-triphosphate reductase